MRFNAIKSHSKETIFDSFEFDNQLCQAASKEIISNQKSLKVKERSLRIPCMCRPIRHRFVLFRNGYIHLTYKNEVDMKKYIHYQSLPAIRRTGKNVDYQSI